jgi:hypothetical protein
MKGQFYTFKFSTEKTTSSRALDRYKREIMKQSSSKEARDILSKGVLSLKSFALDMPMPGVERGSQVTNTEEFIPWFDSDNLFPLHINERARLSTTHSRILQDKVTYIIGDGLNVEGSAAEQKLLRAYFDKCNAAGEDIETVLTRVATDYCTFGNAFLYLVRSEGFTAISHLDATYCRVARPAEKKNKRDKEEKGQAASGILYSRGFNRRRGYKTIPELKPEFIPLYPHFAPTGNGNATHSVLHIKEYTPGYFWYGQIDYYAAYYSGWLDIDYHIPKFNLSRFQQQFKPSGMLVISGRNLTEKQAADMQQEIAKSYTGEGTAGKLLVAIVNDETQAPKFISFDDIPEGAFNELQQIANENIILAHNWHPSLVLQQAGKLSTANDLIAAFEQVYNTVIRRKQAELLKPLRKVLRDCGFRFGDLTISTPAPVSFAGQLDPQKVLTREELRRELGYV